MDWKKSKILLSGASGLVGTALHSSLRASGAQVLQLVRRPPSSPNEIRWDPSANPPATKLDALEGLTATIHLSGANVAAHRWAPAYRREIVTSRVDSTRALSRALAALRTPPQALLVASAIGIYGDRGDALLDELSPAGSGFLAEVCRDWEAAAQAAGYASISVAGIRVVHLRFGVVLAAGQGALGKMTPIFRLGLGGPIGNGRQWMSWIAIQDAVAAIRFLIETASVQGPVNLTAPNPVTNAEFTRALAAQLHCPALLPVPAFALRVAMGQMAEETILASARVRPARLLDAGFQFAYPTIEAALAANLP